MYFWAVPLTTTNFPVGDPVGAIDDNNGVFFSLFHFSVELQLDFAYKIKRVRST